MFDFILGGVVMLAILLLAHVVSWAALKSAIGTVETDVKIAIADVKAEVRKITVPGTNSTGSISQFPSGTSVGSGILGSKSQT